VKKITDNDLRVLVDANADPAERAQALTRLAHWEKGKYLHLEPTIAGLVRDPSFLVRGAAINTLLGWGLEQYIDAAIEMLRTDFDDDRTLQRVEAGQALERYTARFGKHRDRVIRALVAGLRRDPSWCVQAACYRSLLRLLAPDRELEEHDREFDRDQDVDWELLRSYFEN